MPPSIERPRGGEITRSPKEYALIAGAMAVYSVASAGIFVLRRIGILREVPLAGRVYTDSSPATNDSSSQ